MCQWDITGMNKMRKLLLLFAAFITFSATICAQERTKIADGLFLVRYGNTAVIEDDIHQCTLQLKVEKTSQKDSHGQQVYNLFCGNKYTKGVAKTTMKAAITALITKASATIGGAVGGPGGAAAGITAGAFISQYANSIASNFYDDVCNYFSDN